MSWVNWTLFPGRSDCVLLEKGSLVDARGEAAAAADGSEIVLSRALCRFKFLSRREDTTLQEATRVAHLHAESRAPFARAGHAIYRTGEGFAIWWWDAERIADLLGAVRYQPEHLTPESMTYALSDGWRQLQTLEGVEAQYVERGALRASLWRWRAFTDLQWRAFVAAVDAPDVAAPETPPTPVTPTLRADRWRSTRSLTSAPWRQVERIALGAAAAAMVIALGLGAHAMRYGAATDADRAAIAEMTDELTRLSDENGNARNTALVRAAARHAQSPEHLLAAADVLRAMQDAGIEPTGWRSDSARVEATGEGGVESGLEALGVSLESNPRLRDVAPLRKDGAVLITARLETAASALADGAAP